MFPNGHPGKERPGWVGNRNNGDIPRMQDPRPLLHERCVDMQPEVVAILPELCDDEVHPMLHESTDEVHVARQAVEPRDNQRTVSGLGDLQCCRKPSSK